MYRIWMSCPVVHIDRVVSRADSLLGFIFRSTRDVGCPGLFSCSTGSSLGLSWNTDRLSGLQSGHADRLNVFQIRSIRVLGVRLDYKYLAVPIVELEKWLGLHLQEKQDQGHCSVASISRRLKWHCGWWGAIGIENRLPLGSTSPLVICWRLGERLLGWSARAACISFLAMWLFILG